MSEQMKPCPFCGSEIGEGRYKKHSHRWGAVECAECGAIGPDVRISMFEGDEWKAMADTVWNRRASSEHLPADSEHLPERSEHLDAGA